MSKTLKKRAARLELEAQNRVELIKTTLRDYREDLLRGEGPVEAAKSEQHMERVIGEYIQLRKQLRRLHRRMRTKEGSRLGLRYRLR